MNISTLTGGVFTAYSRKVSATSKNSSKRSVNYCRQAQDALTFGILQAITIEIAGDYIEFCNRATIRLVVDPNSMINSAVNRIVLALLLVAAQETLRVDVSLVTVGVQVTDRLGRDVRGLKVENFSIYDDGVPQRIEFFSDEEQPITLGILLDRSDSMSYNAKLERAKEAAVALVQSAREGSEYFYLPFDDHVKLAADLTSDPREIEAAIGNTTLGGGTSLYDAVLEGLSRSGAAHQPRQVLVIISDGADQHSIHPLAEVIRKVRDAKLQVYAIGYFGKDEEPFFRRSGAKLTLIDGHEVDNPRNVLHRLASDSGAEAFFPRSDKELAQAVRKIANDLRTQYTLSFYPPPSINDNAYHPLRVAVRGGRYTVRARPGYNTSSSILRPAQPGQSQSGSD